jgi:hypothetical protein
MSDTFSERLMRGLKEFNMTQDEIINGGWRYCGGDRGRHLNYWRTCHGDMPLPDHESKCVCGHKITENCYITDGKELLVLGMCCIKRFVPKCTRTCERCGEPHKNRIVNRCNECRIGVCDGCGKNITSYNKKCFKCL